MYTASNGRTYSHKETRAEYYRRRYCTAHPEGDTSDDIIGLIVLFIIFIFIL